MASVSQPGLVVNSSQKIEKLRRIPPSGQAIVTEGATVDFDSIVGYLNPHGYLVTVNMAAELGVSPFDVPDVMLKSVGEEVRRGEVIASHRSFYTRSDYVCPEDGVIEQISPYTGRITIRAHPLAVRAHIAGTVERIVPGEGVQIVTHGALLQGIFGIGGIQQGPLAVVNIEEHQPLTPELIKPMHEGSIIAGGSYATLESLERAARLGVKGVVVGSMHKRELDGYLGYSLGTAVTGLERGLTVMLTEGFGQLPMHPRIAALLSNLHGLQATLNGATQVRAGVLRPELIVPHNTKPRDSFACPQAKLGSMTVGQSVRLIRPPRFGHLAKLLDDEPFAHKLVTEAVVMCVRVMLIEDGQVVVVPISNLEAVE